MSLSFVFNKDDPNNSKKKEGAQYLLPVQGPINEILNVFTESFCNWNIILSKGETRSKDDNRWVGERRTRIPENW